MLVSSIMFALGAALVSGAAVHSLVAQRRPHRALEEQRRRQLREANGLYRWLEPLVDELAALHRYISGDSLAKLQWRLKLLPNMPPYLPEEFLAVKTLEGFLLALIMVPAAFVIGVIPAAVFAILITWGYQQLAVMNVRDHVERRRAQLRMRLPFAMDMMALMMNAGASFQESLATVARENSEHPIAHEFGIVQQEIDLGVSRKDALRALDSRLDDEYFHELVYAIVQGDELGTPVSKILSSQAQQLRLVRSQWVEKASGEAQVKLVYPGMLIMVACLLITIAPFLLQIGTVL